MEATNMGGGGEEQYKNRKKLLGMSPFHVRHEGEYTAFKNDPLCKLLNIANREVVMYLE